MVTPIRLVLDGLPHTATFTLEEIAASVASDSSYELQIVPATVRLRAAARRRAGRHDEHRALAAGRRRLAQTHTAAPAARRRIAGRRVAPRCGVWGQGCRAVRGAGRGSSAIAALVLARLLAPPRVAAQRAASGPRPGPDILYAPPHAAPQLENTGVWKAPPILISGASAYRDGEFLYQDLLYDDHGARAARDPGDPRRKSGGGLGPPNGTYTYPTDPVYAGNAADLVELRVKPLPDATAFRVRSTRLKDPERVAFTIAIGGTPGTLAHELPHGAERQRAGGPVPDRARRACRPARRRHRSAGGLAHGEGRPRAPPVRRARAPRRLGPGRVDRPARGRRRAVGRGGRTATCCRARAPRRRPRAAPAAWRRPTAIFNVAFRVPGAVPGAGLLGPHGCDVVARPGCRDCAERRATSARSALRSTSRSLRRARTTTCRASRAACRSTGPMNRILASRFETAPGHRLLDRACAPGHAARVVQGRAARPLQPYAIYVPQQAAAAPPATG